MSQEELPGESIAVDYFDGSSSKRHAAHMYASGQTLRIEGEGISRELAFSQVRWPERTRHGARIAYLAECGSVQCTNTLAWDQWVQAHILQESLVVRAQQSWRWVFLSIAALSLLLIAGYAWLLPAAAKAVVQATPASIDASVGKAALQALDHSGTLQPSAVSQDQQQAIELGLQHAFSGLQGRLPTFNVVFRKFEKGANAFALPGGTVVITDGMVELCKSDPKFLSAVLAHELGHLQHRHGMLLLAKASAMGVVASAIWGDLSGTLASGPVLLGAAGYSRDAEREADTFAVQVLGSLNRSSLEMIDVLDALAKDHPHEGGARSSENGPDALSIAFASHPLDEERREFFKSQMRSLP